MTCGIYLIKNIKTGRKYIGQSIDIERRWKEHKKYQNEGHSYIDNSIKKYNSNIFELSIIYECENNVELLNELEKYYIWKYNTFEDKNHYNLTPGGDFAPMKISEIADKLKRKRPEHSKKMFGEQNPMYNKTHTKEAKEKIRKAQLNTQHPIEHKIINSKSRNTTGYFRTTKIKSDRYKQGFIYSYQYYDDNKKRKHINSVDINKLKQKVKNKGLLWIEF